MHTGIAAGDTFEGIEVFVGSAYNDVFVSDATAHNLVGAGGVDTLDYSGSAQAISLTILNTGAGTGVGGDAQGDTFSLFETYIGSAHDDTFTSAFTGIQLRGGAGNDVYVISNAGSVVVEGVDEGIDEVRTALASYTLSAQVENLTYTGTGAFIGYGNASDNIITGGSGNDILYGGAGADRFVGGAGNDTASYGDSTSGGVTLNFKTGVHTGIAAGDTFEGIEVFVGSAYNDVLVSDATAHNLVGAGGVDTLDYSGSAQAISLTILNTGAGTGAGGDAQGDTFSLFETFIGTAHGDTFTSSFTGIQLRGGAGNDVYVIGNAGSAVVEGVDEGIDEVRTALANYTLSAQVENLTYTGTGAFLGYGNASDNIITGGSGNDVLYGGAGADRFIGGAGNDTVSYSDSTTGGVTLNFKTGVHTGIAAGDTFESIEVFVGSAYNDVFVSDATAHNLVGAGGVDTLDYSGSAQAISLTILNTGAGTGVGGDAQGDTFSLFETYIGSAHDDTFTSAFTGIQLRGGAGNDVYVISNAGSVVVEGVDEGIDEVRTALASYTLSAQVENLTYTGTGAFIGYGNASDNIITGGSGNDILYGGAGADRFVGGAGNDTASYGDSTSGGVTLNFKTGVHTGIAAGDTFEGIEVFAGSAYNDVFFSDATAHNLVGAGGVDTLDYSGSAQAISLTILNTGAGTGVGGDAHGDTFSQFETFIGSAHDDTFTSAFTGIQLRGGAGNDVYVISNGGSAVVEGVDGGIDEVRTALASYTLSAQVENLTYTGTGNFLGYGNASDNIITGGNGNDILYGGAGADRFVGGAGNDSASYGDSTSGGVTLDFKSGVHTGIAAGDTFEGIEVYIGSAYNDVFVSDATAHNLVGAGGVDTLDYSGSAQAISLTILNTGAGTGVGGDAEGDTFSQFETFIGSALGDTFTSSFSGIQLQGGAGNDVYVIGHAGSAVVEGVDGGIDEVRTALAGYSLSAQVENLTYTGTGNFSGYGNASDNIITGGSGNDILYGGAGADRFIGGAGNDTVSYEDSGSSGAVNLNFKTGVYTGIAAGDTFESIEVFRGSLYNDVFVSDATAHNLAGAGGVDTLDYSGSAQAVSLTILNTGAGTGVGGDAQGDTFSQFETFIGTAYDDTFTSSFSGIQLRGGAGNDVYVIGNAGSAVVEGVDGGVDEVRTALANYTLSAQVEILTYTGTGNFLGYGNASDNIITGGNGNDVLYGGAGADQFIGGAGTDTVSYGDSSTGGVTLNFKTGIHTGIASGDTFNGIEKFVGTNQGDIFVGDANANIIDGGAGIDLLSFASETSGVTLDLNGVLTGIVAGDVYTNIEAFEGSAFDDTFTGTALVEKFIGGAGADTINGGAGKDAAWYVTSSAGVSIDLAAGTASGGDAQGDVLSSIEDLAGSAHDDVLIGDAAANMIFGAEGNDIIRGGDGNDYLYGDGIYYSDFGALSRPENRSVAQADIISGGNGDDTIYGGGNDTGSILHGDVGNDFIQTANGKAYGDEGNDRLVGNGFAYELYGGAGADRLDMMSSGYAFGGEGSDAYYVDSRTAVVIEDTGTVGVDVVFLKNIETYNDVILKSDGVNAYIFTKSDWNSGNLDSGVMLSNWFAGSNTIESFQTNNGDTFTIS
ncbi:beta strand repeat-containing protein [Pseudomonas wadenswilerensis]